MTMRAHGKAWNEFTKWCQARGLKPIPAHAWTVATYVRWCEPRQEYADIVSSLKAIARRHLIAGHPDPERNPIVKRTLDMIERRIDNRHQRSALFDEDVFMAKEMEKLKEPEEKTSSPRPSPAPRRTIKSMRSTPKLVSRRRPR